MSNRPVRDSLNPIYENNFAGCLVGLAVGEALGLLVQGKSRREIAATYGVVQDFFAQEPAHQEEKPTLGLNSAMAFVLAESLIATGGKLEPFDFGPRLAQWFEQQGQSIADTALFGALQAGVAQANYQAGPLQKADSKLAARISPLGLLHSYGRFDGEQLRQDCEKASRLTDSHPQVLEGGVIVAVAVRLLCRHDLLPEDLMSAALDYLPFGLPSDNPHREKLLAAQDYLEERQTLVDNIEAGHLLDIDLLRVDLNNLERCGVSNQIAQTVAAAFYAFTARKDSFEEAVTLAVNTGGEAAATLAGLTGALAGAYHGIEAIPQRWRERIGGSAEIIELAHQLHKTVRSRELTDYLSTGI